MKLIAIIVSLVFCGLIVAAEPKAPQERSISVTVTGDVHMPGKYTLPAGSNVWHAIERAGGYDVRGWGKGPVRVTRTKKDGCIIVYVFEEAKKSSYGDAVLLRDGDQISVPTVL